MAVPDPLDERPRQPGGRGGEERVHERLGGLAVGGERRAGVEAEPAEPQDAGAEHDERHRVRRVALARPALALAEHEHGGQRGDAGVDVDGRAAGEVERAPLAEPAAVHPLEHRAVHEQQPQRARRSPTPRTSCGRRPRPEISAGVMHGEHPEEGDRGDRAAVVIEDADVRSGTRSRSCR